MIRLQNIMALFSKQRKEVFKNMPVLVLFVVYPCIALIMTQAMKDQEGTGTLFLSIFATMHCVFTPIVATSSMIAEEKETNTLRVLIMSNVNMKEYLISIGGFILIATTLTGSTFLLMNNHTSYQALQFILSLAMGSFVSIVVGMSIGLYAGNTAAANGLAVPIGMIFSFLPMLSSFNKSIEQVAKFTYGQQISYLMSGKTITLFGIIVLCVNFVILLGVSSVLFKKSLSAE